MKKKRVCLLSLFASLIVFLAACAPVMNTNSQMQFGIQAAQKELWNEAIFRWEKVLEINPESGAAYNNLAVAFEKKGEFDNAEKAYKMAIKLAPKNKYIQSNYEKFKTRQEPPKKKKTGTEKNNEKK